MYTKKKKKNDGQQLTKFTNCKNVLIFHMIT